MISTITEFETIPIDRTSIPQCELNIENKTRSNLFAWNGQFSPQFIETLLNSYAHDEDIVLDPFAGSGTTLYEAGRKGLSAYGAELNPSAYYMAKTYELINRTRPERHALIHGILYAGPLADFLAGIVSLTMMWREFRREEYMH